MQMNVAARRALDRRSARLRELPEGTLARPHGGWLRAMRQALGMSSAELGSRLGVSRVSVHRLEEREVSGTIGLDTLVRAADALGCDVVYALVPRVPLDTQVRRQAEAVARAQLRPVVTTMALEDQAVDDGASADLLADRVAQLVDSRGLWAARA